MKTDYQATKDRKTAQRAADIERLAERLRESREMADTLADYDRALAIGRAVKQGSDW